MIEKAKSHRQWFISKWKATIEIWYESSPDTFGFKVRGSWRNMSQPSKLPSLFVVLPKTKNGEKWATLFSFQSLKCILFKIRSEEYLRHTLYCVQGRISSLSIWCISCEPKYWIHKSHIFLLEFSKRSKLRRYKKSNVLYFKWQGCFPFTLL